MLHRRSLSGLGFNHLPRTMGRLWFFVTNFKKEYRWQSLVILFMNWLLNGLSLYVLYKITSVLFETALFHSVIWLSCNICFNTCTNNFTFTTPWSYHTKFRPRLNSRDLIVAVQPFNEMSFSQCQYVIWYILYTSVLCLPMIVFNQYMIILNYHSAGIFPIHHI